MRGRLLHAADTWDPLAAGTGGQTEGIVHGAIAVCCWWRVEARLWQVHVEKACD